MKSFIVDACVWIEYLKGNDALAWLAEEKNLKTTTLTVAEVVRVLLREKKASEAVRKALEVINQKSVVLDLDFQTAAKAGEIAVKERLPLADSIVYAYASPENIVLTADRDFEGKPFVEFVKKPA